MSVSPSSTAASETWFDGIGTADVKFDLRGLPEWDHDSSRQGESGYANDWLIPPRPTDSGAGIPLGDPAESPPLPQDEEAKVTFIGLAKDQVWRAVSDHREFYSARSLLCLAGGLGAGAAMANTGFDEHLIRDSVLDSIVFAPSDEFYEALHEPKFLGDGWFTIPVFAIAAYSEPVIADLPLGEATAHWGQRSLRTILVGGPPLLALQWVTGGSRPGETSHNSHWRPLEDTNGVSGHAFMGAVPFLSAAKMADNPWLKAGFYVVSTLPGLSRVNDDEHYFSQAFLGWWLAYLAASAVDETETGRAAWHVYPVVTDEQVGVVVDRSF